MTDEQAVDEVDEHKHHPRGGGGGPQGDTGGLIYVLGAIGAGVYYWKRADEPQQKALGVLKSFIWPATLVYEAFNKLKVD